MGLYLIRADMGSSSFIKIGVTSGCPMERLAGIATGCPVKPYVIAFDPRAGVDDEQHLHRRLANYRSNLEWFHYTGDVVVFVRAMRNLYPVDPTPKELERQSAHRLSRAMETARRMTERREEESNGEGGLGSTEDDCPIIVNRYSLTPVLRPWLGDLLAQNHLRP